MTDPKPKPVVVVAYDERWPETFRLEADRLYAAFGPAASAIHHVGSTSVPGLCAKPVIDILVESPDLEMIDRATPRLEALRYTAKGEYGIPGRRYFSRPAAGSEPKVHVHAFRRDSPRVARHLRFRGYLRTHAAAAGEYGALKRRLAADHPNDAGAYQDGKADLIGRLEVEAALWAEDARSAKDSGG